MLKPSHVQTKHLPQLCVSLQHAQRVHASMHIQCKPEWPTFSSHSSDCPLQPIPATLSCVPAMQAWQGRCTVSRAPGDLKEWRSAQVPALPSLRLLSIATAPAARLLPETHSTQLGWQDLHVCLQGYQGKAAQRSEPQSPATSCLTLRPSAACLVATRVAEH